MYVLEACDALIRCLAHRFESHADADAHETYSGNLL